ncbi:MAG: DNA/RNA non-specific endonuclease [Ignavibacteriales bacterium]|nr:DNA/RNA non-specific endonuclease [Ignavibacteriales bacterium]
MKNKYYLIFLILLCGSFTEQSTAQEFNYQPKTKKGFLVQHKYYSLSYVHKYKDAEWVAYRLTNTMIVGPAERKDNFCYDSLVPGGTAGKDDYPGKDYDRGHLCPAEDMSFSQEATDSTFYMSNMTPQMGSFNRGIWKKLEMKVREWAKKYKELYVVSGAVLKNGLQRIGPKKDISVPMQFYKVVLVNTKTDKKMIAFLFPHKKSDAALATFAVPADSVEKITGIDFFPALPNKLEKELERKVVLDGWDGVQ